MSKSAIEEALALQLRALKLPAPVREYQFAPDRRWRLDFAWPERKLAVEVEGGIWINGRHSRGVGMKADMTKYNRLSLLGWMLLRFDGGAVKDGTAVRQIQEALT